jgi:UDP-glucuronate decarboxylase
MMNGPDEFHGPVNLGNPGEFTILQLAEIVQELSGTSSKIVFRPALADDPMQRQPVIDLAQKWLGGWEPTIQLREGLSRTIEWFKTIDMSQYRAPTPNY